MAICHSSDKKVIHTLSPPAEGVHFLQTQHHTSHGRLSHEHQRPFPVLRELLFVLLLCLPSEGPCGLEYTVIASLSPPQPCSFQPTLSGKCHWRNGDVKKYQSLCTFFAHPGWPTPFSLGLTSAEKPSRRPVADENRPLPHSMVLGPALDFHVCVCKGR